MGILIIDVVVGFGALIKLVILAQSFIIRYRRVKRLASRKRRFELCPLLRGLSFAKSKGATVEVISSLASLSSLDKEFSIGLRALRRVRQLRTYYHSEEISTMQSRSLNLPLL